MRSRRATPVWLISFVDMLLALNIVLAAFVWVILPQINPPASSFDPPGQLNISLSWEPGNDDIDLWAMAPGQEIATGYSAKTGKVFALLRDDMGDRTDSSPLNAEFMSGSATPAGEYIINVHAYRAARPIKVWVEAAMIRNGTAIRIIGTEIELRDGQEKTVVRFKLDAKGEIVSGSVNHVFQKLRSAKK